MAFQFSQRQAFLEPQTQHLSKLISSKGQPKQKPSNSQQRGTQQPQQI